MKENQYSSTGTFNGIPEKQDPGTWESQDPGPFEDPGPYENPEP